MSYNKNKIHYIVVTGIIINSEGKYLIVKRADWEKAFPGRWTVPGGKLEVLDYALKEKDTKFHWYNILENSLKRETKEEVGLEIENIGYVTSLAFINPEEIPTLVISLYAYSKQGEHVRLDDSLTDFKWVSLDEARNYDLIEGIYQEIEILDKFLKNKEKDMIWEKNDS